MAKSKKSLIVLIAISLIVVVLLSLYLLLQTEQSNLRIGEQEVSVTIAQTPEEQRQGLSGTGELKSGTGMLFVYNSYVVPQFWMKDMNYPIDIIWIRDASVTGFVESAPIPVVGQELPRYQPDEPINYVLEVPAGFVDTHGIEIGDQVDYQLGN